MLKLKPQFQNKNGFTLIELVLGVAIMSMLIITLYTCLNFTLQLSRESIVEDEILLNGRYTLEYIKEEICSADKIIASSNFKSLDSIFPTNIGFVILKLDKDLDKVTGKLMDDIIYSYTTYYFRDDSVVRINAKKLIHKDKIIDWEGLKSTLPKADEFSGFNAIGYDLLEESQIVLNESNSVSLKLSFKTKGSKATNFKSDISIRCEVVR